MLKKCNANLFFLRNKPMKNVYQHVVSEVITPLLRKALATCFHIHETQWGVTVTWKGGGILFSCPRDLNPDKHLCEVSAVTSDNRLIQYFRGNRHRLRSIHELIPTVYEAYFHCCVVNRIRAHVLRFHIHRAIQRHQKSQSLLHRCFHSISTLDTLLLRSMML